MLTSRHSRFRRFIGSLVIIFGAVCHPSKVNAEGWGLMGTLLEWDETEFCFR